jgi:hypothetical protein
MICAMGTEFVHFYLLEQGGEVTLIDRRNRRRRRRGPGQALIGAHAHRALSGS